MGFCEIFEMVEYGLDNRWINFWEMLQLLRHQTNIMTLMAPWP